MTARGCCDLAGSPCSCRAWGRCRGIADPIWWLMQQQPAPCPFPSGGREQSEVLLGSWHPRQLRPSCAAPASRHGGDLQDLAAPRASSSIWPRRCSPFPPRPFPSCLPWPAPKTHRAAHPAPHQGPAAPEALPKPATTSQCRQHPANICRSPWRGDGGDAAPAPFPRGRAGCPPARRLRVRCWHRQLERRGGWPRLPGASCCFAHLPLLPAPCLGSHAWGRRPGQPTRRQAPRREGLAPASMARAPTGTSPWARWELLGEDALNEPRHLQRLKDSRPHPRNKRRRLSGAERRAR